MRICLIYDCLFPHTVGGAERWYRNLAERLVAEGHEVTYLTLRQWDRGVDPCVEGVDVRAVGPRLKLYSAPGRRRILPPVVFGLGVLWHLLRHGRRYDVVHTASFPYFSLLAAAAARLLGGYRLVVDWHEVWTPAYWREYLGRAGGRIGYMIQRRCARIDQSAFCFSRLHAARLRAEGLRGAVTVLEGEYGGSTSATRPAAARPLVVFAGRHIPEKRAEMVVPAVMLAAQQISGLQGVIFGDGPQHGRVLETIRESGAGDVIEAPGFVTAERMDDTMRSALCLILPSRREGYGLVVVEASSLGIPSIVVREPDNAALELIEEGENGTIAASADAVELAAAIVRIHQAGRGLRDTTADWYARNEARLSLTGSLDNVIASYEGSGGQ